jgi:gamma-glutamyl hydrolase
MREAARLAALLLLVLVVALAASPFAALAKRSSLPSVDSADSSLSSSSSSSSNSELRWADAEAHLLLSARSPAAEQALRDVRDRLAGSKKETAAETEEKQEQKADGIVIDDDDDDVNLLLRRKPSSSLPPVLTNRPLVGIISQPGDPATGKDSYIAASYVKFVEAAGARVVPFFHDAPQEETDARFAAVNGVLIPGGAARLAPGHTFFDVAARVIDLATDANLKRKQHFPIFAICLGFEALGVHLSGNSSLLSSFDAEDTAAPLYFTEAAENSRLFGSMPRRVRESLASKPYARESHSWGISLTSFEAEEKLKENLEVLSLSSDPEGRVYVSSMEHKTLPFSATQW